MDAPLLPDPTARRLVDALVAATSPADAGVSLAVHPHDTMFESARTAFAGTDLLAWPTYVRSALHAADTLDPLLAALPADARLLDFASGYGRMTRLWVRRLAPRRIWVSEVLPGAVEFQRDAFGVHAVPSAHDPATVELPGSFHAILVLSLFSHLPDARFRTWLRRLAAALGPDSVLVFSVHGAEGSPAAGLVGESGLHFERLAEHQRDALDLDEYGTSWVTEAYVRRAIAEACGPDVAVVRRRGALWHRQDLWVAARGAGAAWAERVPEAGPRGFVERVDPLADGGVAVAGWASSPLGETRVELCVDGAVVGAGQADLPRPDVAAALGLGRVATGFRVEIPAAVAQSGDATLVARAVDGGGRVYPMHTSTVGMLALSVRLENAVVGFEGERLALRVRLEEQRRLIDAYRTSRAWRTAEAWRALRARLRHPFRPSASLP